MATATVLVTGNTYPVKDQLKALGGRWDAQAKGWRVPADKASEAQALVSGAPKGYVRSTTAAPRRSYARRGARYCEGWGADNPHAPRPPYTCHDCCDD